MLATFKVLTLMFGMELELFQVLCVLTNVDSSFSFLELSGQKSRHFWNSKNVGTRCMGACP